MTDDRPEQTADDPIFEFEVDEQVRRLRRMLVLMAPERGSSALGATRQGFAESRFEEKVPALTERRH